MLLATIQKLLQWLVQYSFGCSGHLSMEPLQLKETNKTEFSATQIFQLLPDVLELHLLLDSFTVNLK